MFQYRLVFPEGRVDSGFLDDVPVRLVDLAGFVDGNSADRKKVSEDLAQIEALIAKAKEQLQSEPFFGHRGTFLLRGLEKVRALRESVKDMSSKSP